MPTKILKQIQYLCSQISKVEWSGILFYSITGDISAPKTFKIKLEEILPMDMGTSAYTSYELDNRYVDFLMDNPHAMEWKMGHIHSHNTMPVYFSGTDMSELNDNAPNHNYYLSLIVNNFMEFCAKLCYMGEGPDSLNVDYTGLNSEGEKYVISSVPLKVDSKILCVHDCVIKSPVKKLTSDKGFMGKVAEIMKPKPKPVQKWEKKKNTNPVKIWENGQWVDNPANNPNVPVKHLKENPLANPNLNEDNADAQIFLMTLLSFGKPPSVGDDVESLLGELTDLEVTGSDLAQYISANYNLVYEQLFADDLENPYGFLDIITEIIEELEAVIEIFPFLGHTLGYLIFFKDKYEEEIVSF